MKYSENNIGVNAGKVWECMYSSTHLTLKQIIELTNLSRDEVVLSIGWLSKEGKINVSKKGKSVLFDLKQ